MDERMERIFGGMEVIEEAQATIRDTERKILIDLVDLGPNPFISINWRRLRTERERASQRRKVV